MTIQNEAAAAVQARISSILNSTEGQTNRPLAEHLAFKTTMSVSDAKAALRAAGPTAAIALARAGWTKAVEQVNAAMAPATYAEANAQRDVPRKSGWSKAVANANSRFAL